MPGKLRRLVKGSGFFNGKEPVRPIPRVTATCLCGEIGPLDAFAMTLALMPSMIDDQTPGLFESALVDSGSEGELSRSQILEHILSINPTASWLVGEAFDRSQLWNYLQHLLVAMGPRGRSSAWVRPADSPAISYREPID